MTRLLGRLPVIEVETDPLGRPVALRRTCTRSICSAAGTIASQPGRRFFFKNNLISALTNALRLNSEY